MNANVLIYEPQRQQPLGRTLFGMITLIAWMAYVYLLLPLLTLLLWWLGLRTAFLELWLPQHALDRTLLVTLPLLALVCAALLIGWAEINRMRFVGHERRAAADDASPEEIAQCLGVAPATAADLRSARIATVVTDQSATPQQLHVRQSLS